MIYKFKKKYTWIVTGGAGFIGSNLISLLLKSNQKVICIDNFVTGKKINIKNFYLNKNFILLKKDIREKINLNLKADFFIHLAALGSVPRSFLKSTETNDVNVTGSLKMYELSKKLNVKKFIFASSSSVYGNSKNKIKKESDKLNPISPYGLSKYIFEKYLFQISHQYEINCYGLRFFNVYGPNQNDCGPYAPVISKWIRNSIQKKVSILFGNGRSIRDFTHVDNVLTAIISLALCKRKISKFNVFNIGTGRPISLNDLYKKIKNKLNKFNIKMRIRKEKSRDGDIKFSSSDISKAKIFFSYTPLVYIDEGLDKYINCLIKNGKK
jgi:UDP-N-acetylglucosamine 4-epimerase